MPRLPGRESTRRRVPLADALVARFYMAWENVGGQCCIEGCEHVLAEECEPVSAEPMPGPGLIVRESNIEDYIGHACRCCMARILE